MSLAIQAASGGIRADLLDVFQEICELARPEIAASVVVAGACKVAGRGGSRHGSSQRLGRGVAGRLLGRVSDW